MTEGHVATKAVTIDAPPDRIWEALTDPAQVSQYMFGAEIVTDWVRGGPIVFRGVWEGTPFEDKGTILDIDPPVFLRTSYYSPLSGKPDTPENYAIVTYRVSRDGKASRLTVTQSNIAGAEELAQTESNWDTVLATMRAMIES
ncbi:MAG: SRPBCC domain-containing protein [Devosia nanyangense]|uniref:SRPBCC domain-containing protein n=1 Tax=Devosia nanyangense TaxID=1228055 RepID=A0A933L1M9_9HYPH|nr:SRPBCC domain-containing protein [Devosia nanyangense]